MSQSHILDNKPLHLPKLQLHTQERNQAINITRRSSYQLINHYYDEI